ncbi:MAG: hypothetical protein D6766_02165 [Verrucomicrobia bacterium]|nr:MAG: hypothetical protein D6766_02165 [Verrucomicrobiota bacterium]
MQAPVRWFAGFGLATLLVAGLVAAYQASQTRHAAEADAEEPVVAPTLIHRTAEGRVVLELDAAAQARLGVRAARLAPGVATGETPAMAAVLDPTPLVAQLDAIRAAEARVEAANRPYQRLRQLHENGLNASAAAVEAAQAQLAQARIALEAARHRLESTWGPALASLEDLPGNARRLAAREAALVRLDLLPPTPPPETGTALDLLDLAGRKVADARVLGPGPSTESALAGHVLLALVETNAAALVPGLRLTARFKTPGATAGFVLPRPAVVRDGGRPWVYVQETSTTFTRREVTLERPHPEGWLVTGEWPKPVVVAGAQSLLSEELKGRIRMRE